MLQINEQRRFMTTLDFYSVLFHSCETVTDCHEKNGDDSDLATPRSTYMKLIHKECLESKQRDVQEKALDPTMTMMQQCVTRTS